jgi:ankyrin repeat protein
MHPILKHIRNGDIHSVKSWVASGADVNSPLGYGWRAIHCAASVGNSEIFDFLLDCGAKIRTIGPWCYTPFTFAAESGNIEIIQTLLDIGIGIDEADQEGRQAIHAASRGYNVSMVDFLIDNGANIESEDFYSRRPIHYACMNGGAASFLIVKLLIDTYGAKIDVCDKSGYYPLHHAASSGSIDIAKYLIKKGANPSQKTAGGLSPQEIATDELHLELAALLVSAIATTAAGVTSSYRQNTTRSDNNQSLEPPNT